jgi:hypothetical protein
MLYVEEQQSDAKLVRAVEHVLRAAWRELQATAPSTPRVRWFVRSDEPADGYAENEGDFGPGGWFVADGDVWSGFFDSEDRAEIPNEIWLRADLSWAHTLQAAAHEAARATRWSDGVAADLESRWYELWRSEG